MEQTALQAAELYFAKYLRLLLFTPKPTRLIQPLIQAL
jgi:hypothetical protein